MAYMHRETFDIAQNLDPGDSDRDEVYFQVDDLIEPVIQVLNRKGYITATCCSGHPFDDVIGGAVDYRFPIWSHISFKAGITLPSLPPGFALFDEKRHTVYPDKPPADLTAAAPSEGKSIDISETDLRKIQIAHGIYLFIIERFYDESDDAYAVFREILDAMEQLYKWALDLPDFKEE